MKSVKFCRDCKHSMESPRLKNELLCTHQDVVADMPYVLASMPMSGVWASEERKLKFFGKCGVRGKLWESKQ